MIASASGGAAKLPPSVRDFQIYRFVKFECNSTREAAHEFELSQTRVRQVMARVVEFLIESAPRGADDEAGEERLYVAEQLAREQLDYLYQRAMKAFDDTQREDVHGNLLPGKVGYLAVAARIVLCLAKVPVHGLPAFREDGLDDEEDRQEECRAAERRANDSSLQVFLKRVREAEERAQIGLPVASAGDPTLAASDTTNDAADGAGVGGHADESPPNADCSAHDVSRGKMPPAAAALATATASEDGTYRPLDEIKAAARKRFLSTAQATDDVPLMPPVLGEEDGAVEQPQEPRRPLNRKERRARERLLKRALAKK